MVLVVKGRPLACEQLVDVDMQLNKDSNWNHLKAVIAASDTCAKFDQISVGSLHFLIKISCKFYYVFWILGSNLITRSLNCWIVLCPN